MSLINNMLKDLQQRESRHRGSPYLLMHQPKTKKILMPWKKITAVAISATLILLLIAVMGNKPHPHATLKFVDTDINPIKSKEEMSDSLTWLQPTFVTGITLQVKDNITEVTFLLNHAALYRLVSNDLNNQLTLVFENAQLQAEIPPTQYLHTAIQNLTVKRYHDDVRFNLNLVPGAAIKYVNLNENEKNPELVVGIEYTPVATPKENQNEQAVKTPVMQSLLTQQYQDAVKEAENGQYQPAINHLTNLLKIDPGYKDVRVSLTALLIDQSYLLQATKIIDEGLKLNPTFPPFIELKARLLATEGKAQKALTLLLSISPPMQENPDYHAFIAALYEQTNDSLAAAGLYKQLLQINPRNGNWWLGLGLSLDKLNKKADATTAYKKALAEGNLNTESLAYLRSRLHSLEEVNDERG